MRKFLYILTILVISIFLFVIPQKTLADHIKFDISITCPTPKSDQKLVVFMLSEDDNNPPTSGKQACYAVSKTASAITFEQLSDPDQPITLLDKSWATVDAVGQSKGCGGVFWDDDSTIDPDAKDIAYKFTTYIKKSCGAGVTTNADYRYRIQPSGGDKYLYYVGEKKADSTINVNDIISDDKSPTEIVEKGAVLEKKITFKVKDGSATVIDSISCDKKWAGLLCNNVQISPDKKSATLNLVWEVKTAGYEIDKTYQDSIHVYKNGNLTDSATFVIGIKVIKEGTTVKDCAAMLKNATCGGDSCKDLCVKNPLCSYVNNQCINTPSLSAEEKQKLLTDAINKANAEKYKAPAISNFLPNCAYPGTCDDINDLLLVFIKIAQFLFKIIGTAAFLFFVYGGFMMVLSMGNADRVKQGREALVAAVIGLIIAFSAYTLVDLILDSLQVSNEYRATGLLDTAKDPKKK